MTVTAGGEENDAKHDDARHLTTGGLPSAVFWCDQPYAEEYSPISKSDSTTSTWGERAHARDRESGGDGGIQRR